MKVTIRSKGRARQRGLTMIEVVTAIGIIAISTAGLAELIAKNQIEAKSKAVADRMIEVSEASKAYVRANYTSLIGSVPVGGGAVAIAVGRTSAAAAPPAGSLQALGFLPPGYIDVNGYGQNHVLLVRQPAAGQLEAIISTVGGSPIPDQHLIGIPTRIGANGGSMLSNPLPGTTGQIVGAQGGWRTPAATWNTGGISPASGHVMAALSFETNTVLSDYLSRTNIGIPEANAMHTSIDMNGNDLNEVRRISMPGQAGAVSAIQDLADGQGLQIASSSGTVQLRDPSGGAIQHLAVTGSVSSCGSNANGCGVRVGDDGGFYDYNDGWVRFEGNNNGLHVSGPGNNLFVDGMVKAFAPALTSYPAAWGPGVWSRDVYAEGTVGFGTNGNLQGGYVNSMGQAHLANSLHTPVVRLTNNDHGSGDENSDELSIFRVNTAVNQTEMRINVGDDAASGATAGVKDYLTIGGTSGGVFMEQFRFDIAEATMTTKDLYVTNRSSTVPVSALLPKFVPQYSYLATPANNAVPKPPCPAGGQQKIIVIPVNGGSQDTQWIGGAGNFTTRSWYSIRATNHPTDPSNAWVVQMDHGPTDMNISSALATTYCYYP